MLFRSLADDDAGDRVVARAVKMTRDTRERPSQPQGRPVQDRGQESGQDHSPGSDGPAPSSAQHPEWLLLLLGVGGRASQSHLNTQGAHGFHR